MYIGRDIYLYNYNKIQVYLMEFDFDFDFRDDFVLRKNFGIKVLLVLEFKTQYTHAHA